MTTFTESVVEEAALAWLERLGWMIKHGPEITPGELATERSDFGQVFLTQRLQDAVAPLNPTLPAAVLDDASRRLTRLGGQTLEARNCSVHCMLVGGATGVCRHPEARRGEGLNATAQRATGFDGSGSGEALGWAKRSDAAQGRIR